MNQYPNQQNPNPYYQQGYPTQPMGPMQHRAPVYPPQYQQPGSQVRHFPGAVPNSYQQPPAMNPQYKPPGSLTLPTMTGAAPYSQQSPVAPTIKPQIAPEVLLKTEKLIAYAPENPSERYCPPPQQPSKLKSLNLDENKLATSFTLLKSAEICRKLCIENVISQEQYQAEIDGITDRFKRTRNAASLHDQNVLYEFADACSIPRGIVDMLSPKRSIDPRLFNIGNTLVTISDALQHFEPAKINTNQLLGYWLSIKSDAQRSGLTAKYPRVVAIIDNWTQVLSTTDLRFTKDMHNRMKTDVDNLSTFRF